MVYCTGLENRQAATSQRFESFSLRKLALSHNGSAADSGSASGGSNPSGVYMEFVAQLVECQVVALVVVGSIPIKLPNASIAQW